MDNGWIKLHRSLQKHWLWDSTEPFDKRSAWIDLLMLANFTDVKVMRKGELKQRTRGEVNTSMAWLADRWKWDRRTVKRFLDVLQKDGMVSVNSTRDGTTVTIEKYAIYQGERTTQCTTQCTTECTTECTHDKKVKKYKKDNKDNNYKNDYSMPVGYQYRDPITGRIRFNTGGGNGRNN